MDGLVLVIVTTFVVTVVLIVLVLNLIQNKKTRDLKSF